ncbi:AraC family transcriptional regulator [Paenibacillus ehimensis]|uniref:AraC family transcriptional regulator n=1 Tax=Paenibacillus ehimensis TaxID=79264 RepID=A0ABT8V4X4_9BACL|nr:AraC family transcriptional regulator [Paenibacillus ehimensis]MDO3676486.1 AraC family transcriptional regulator [Paenibacillus ehimensis]MEC0208388.1 AraC family transcriptional regulator [Paenibacillus ehimensis]
MDFPPFARTNRTLYLLSSVRKFNRPNSFLTGPRKVSVPVLCFVAKGKALLRLNDIVHHAEAHQLLYLAPGTTIEAAAQSSELVYFVILVRTVTAARRGGCWTFVDAPSASVLPLAPGHVHIGNAGQVLRRIEELYAASKNEAGMRCPDPDLLLQSFLDRILQGLPQSQAETAASGGIDLCIAYMREHFHEKITREALADIAKLTPNAFCRSFKRATGMSQTEYLNRIRIERAKERLSPGVSVKEVAVSVGYGSEYYFSRIFKETVGLSPTLFIKRERLNVATASRLGFQDNLSSIGLEAAAAIDCYRLPGMDDTEYGQRLLSQLEQLRLVKPDLIIADFYHQSVYESLKQIAPTLVVKHHLDWRATHLEIAKLVGREQEAVQTFKQLEERTADARGRLRRTMERASVTVMQVLAKRVRLQGTVNHPLNELLYEELGLKPGNAVPRNKMRDEWLPEELPKLDSGHLLVIKNGSQPEVEALLGHLQQWHRRDPIRKGLRTHFIPNWLVMSWTPPGRNRIIDEIVDLLTWDSGRGLA